MSGTDPKRTVIVTSYRVYGEPISPTASCTPSGMAITDAGEIVSVHHTWGETEFIQDIPEYLQSYRVAPTPVQQQASEAPRMTYNSDTDAAYIYLRKLPFSRTDHLDFARHVDVSEDGEPIGIELLYVSDGVDLRDLPSRDIVAALLQERHIPIVDQQ